MINVFMGAAQRLNNYGLNSITRGAKYWKISVIFAANSVEFSIDCARYDLAQHLHVLQEPFFFQAFSLCVSADCFEHSEDAMSTIIESQAFSTLFAYYRDTELAPGFLARYEVGLLMRDPTFLFVTEHFGGFCAPHRFLILSENARHLGGFSASPEMGICALLPDTIMKVIAVHQQAGYAQVTLLEIPEASQGTFTTEHLSEFEQSLVDKAQQRFQEALTLHPRPELTTADWLERVRPPVGINDAGEFRQTWRYGNDQAREVSGSISPTKESFQPNPVICPAPSVWARRLKQALGVFCVGVGGYILIQLAQQDDTSYKLASFGLVAMGLGAWVAWRPDDLS